MTSRARQSAAACARMTERLAGAGDDALPIWIVQMRSIPLDANASKGNDK